MITTPVITEEINRNRNLTNPSANSPRKKEQASPNSPRKILPPNQFIKKLQKYHDMKVTKPEMFSKPHGIRQNQVKPYRSNNSSTKH
jgi:hypothetical protein